MVVGEVFLWRGRENEKSERGGKGVFIVSSKAKIADRGKKDNARNRDNERVRVEIITSLK